MQGIIVSFVGPANFGILYSGIAAAELIMELAGGSIFVATFEGAAGEHNRRLLGIPIAMSAVRYILSNLITFGEQWLMSMVVGISGGNGAYERI